MHWLGLQEGKKRARKLVRIYDAYWRDPDFSYVGSRYEQTLVRTRTPCSCVMCGNPRRHYKGVQRLTLQERRAADEMLSEMQLAG